MVRTMASAGNTIRDMQNASRLTLLALAAGLLFAACAAVQQQKATQTRAADTGQFHNLQVLPQNITHDELVATMRAWSRALGTRCDHCHAANPAGSAEQINFPSDAKPEKNVARAMARMTAGANHAIAGVNTHGQTITCYTCHRGHTVPDTSAPAEGAPPAQPRQ